MRCSVPKSCLGGVFLLLASAIARGQIQNQSGRQRTVKETDSLFTISGEFSFGPRKASLTISKALYEEDPLTVFVQVPSDATASATAPQLYVESGGEMAPLRNGAALQTPLH